jgi:hypothetical protein
MKCSVQYLDVRRQGGVKYFEICNFEIYSDHLELSGHRYVGGCDRSNTNLGKGRTKRQLDDNINMEFKEIGREWQQT